DVPVIERIMAVNVVAMAATFSPLIATMKAQARQGRVCRLVGVAGVAGIRGLPGSEAYSASKAAVISYCDALRAELRGAGIRVVSVAPGYEDAAMCRVNPYPIPFLVSSAQFGERAAQVSAKGKSYAVAPWQTGVVAKLLSVLPNAD